MLLTIHQPEHLIWLGLVDKISKADQVVMLDSVQFEKNYFQNRNKIRTPQGWMWLTVPVKKHDLNKKICEIEISYDHDWVSNYLDSIKVNYSKAPFFTEYYPKIEQLIERKYKFLSVLNLQLINLILAAFKLKKELILSSSLDIDNSIGGSKVVMQICKKMQADEYLSGPTGNTYLDLGDFRKANIKIQYHQFEHPVYKQNFKGFETCMSSVDMLFNHGKDSNKILWGNK